ncbi:MAG TPA: hypothetical protein PK573_08350 [Spirochaetota bacterium]|nr:hypothetical protein [Spirochaetota bacterium]
MIDNQSALKIMDMFLSESDKKCVHDIMQKTGKAEAEILAEITRAGFSTMMQEAGA